MATDKQNEANRRNARKSTGPRTEAGKNRSRLNAFRHGLTGQLDILPDDLKEAHDTFIARFRLSLAPADDPLENQLAHSIAESYWRLNRIPIVENVLLLNADYVRSEHNRDNEYTDFQRAFSSVRALVENPQQFNLLTVYEMRLYRKAQSELKQLRQLQAERRATEEDINEEVTGDTAPVARPKAAAAGVQPIESTEASPQNGFVFSAAPDPPIAVDLLPLANLMEPTPAAERLGTSG